MLLSTVGPLVAQAMAVIAVSSPAIPNGGAIPAAYSNYGANLSPPLAWTAVPGARSYALILDDPDAPGNQPFVHWLIWNIPATTTALPAGLAAAGRPAAPAGPEQGRNDADGAGYFGPRPPSGVHHYHFHLFALDTTLTLSPGADRRALGAAMGGHILAAGEMVATFAAPGGR
jgi:Raf kinase inhibitor-like YbhB/YbcL family protein